MNNLSALTERVFRTMYSLYFQLVLPVPYRTVAVFGKTLLFPLCHLFSVNIQQLHNLIILHFTYKYQ